MENDIGIKQKIYSTESLTYTSRRQMLLACTIVMLARQSLGLVAACLVPLLSPLLLDKAGANAAQIAIVIGTIPSILNTVLCPIISTISDKTRTKMGRRTPYLLFSAPILGLILVLLGYAKELAAGILSVFPSITCNVQFWLLAILLILFQIAFLFPGSVVYYLEADIIPTECFGQYSAIASILGSVTCAGFAYFVTAYVEFHMKAIIWIFAISYVTIYVLQAVMVKEGKYPPVHDKLTRGGSCLRHMTEYVVMFFRQCFSRKIYIALALCGGLNAASTVCRTMYNLLFATKDLGVSLEFYGKIGAFSGIISAVLVYFAGRLMDRTHPMLIYGLGMAMVIFTNIFGFFFVHGPKSYAVIAIITTLVYSFQGLANIPLMVRILLPDKFGQLSSGNSMICHVIMICASVFAGLITNTFGYRVMFVWDFIITIIALYALYIVYREWQRFGGKNYKAPSVD